MNGLLLGFLGKLPLRVDAIAAADNEHPDCQLGVGARTLVVAGAKLELLGQGGERCSHKHVDEPLDVVLGNAIFDPKRLEHAARLCRGAGD